MNAECGEFKPGIELTGSNTGIQVEGKKPLIRRMQDLVGNVIFKFSRRFNPLGATEGEDTPISLPVGPNPYEITPIASGRGKTGVKTETEK